MIKLKFSGYINNGLKRERNDNSYYNGTTSFFFFISLFYRIFGSKDMLDVKFYKKNKYNLCFIKSNIRYKVSKHLVNRICNRYIITLKINGTPRNMDFIVAFKFVAAFSSVYLNSNYIRIIKNQKMLNFLKFFWLI